MRVRKMTALMLAGAMTASMGTFAFADEAKELPTIDSIKLGEDYTDLTASIKVLTHRTDIVDTTFQDYIKKFNESYPNITIEYEAVTEEYNDIQIMEEAPTQIRDKILSCAETIDNMMVDRRILKSTEHKLSNAAYRRMEAVENEMPGGIKL